MRQWIGVDMVDVMVMGNVCWPMLAQLIEGITDAVHIDVLWIGCSDPASTTTCSQLVSKALLTGGGMLAWHYDINDSAIERTTMEDRKRGYCCIGFRRSLVICYLVILIPP